MCYPVIPGQDWAQHALHLAVLPYQNYALSWFAGLRRGCRPAAAVMRRHLSLRHSSSAARYAACLWQLHWRMCQNQPPAGLLDHLHAAEQIIKVCVLGKKSSCITSTCCTTSNQDCAHTMGQDVTGIEHCNPSCLRWWQEGVVLLMDSSAEQAA